MLHAIVMAGGSGTRFWPASRNLAPKQLLQLVGNATMLRQTFDRLGDVVPIEHRLIMTNERLTAAVCGQLPELPAEAVIGEPCKRDTAPCIALAALLVSRRDREATLVVTPADHVIRPANLFQAAIRQAAALIEKSPGRIVTFGIRPTYAAEVFGYIQRGHRLETTRNAPHTAPPARKPPTPPTVSPVPDAPAFAVQRFREKPDAATARQYVESGDYYWNSGIFVWRATTILEAIRERQPAMLTRLETIADAWNSPDRSRVFEREFAAIEPISIDYAVMEKATDVAVIEATFEWDDLGSWQSLARLAGSDPAGNTILGRHLGLGTSDSIVRTDDDHLVVTLGLKNCLVVHTPNATLVADKHREEQIRQVVQRLEEMGWNEYL
ncbi:MAG: mannose-1-phosphate guanylyltransferase [Pirellulales bacterium]|nr:mannose-1-phosphate guanylyltransferase [Pirellulales bacterium]